MFMLAFSCPKSRLLARLGSSTRLYASGFDDSKLRQIIETSNLGMAHQLEKQKREIDQSQKSTTSLAKIERDYKAAQRQVIGKIQGGNVGTPTSYTEAKQPQEDRPAIAKLLLQLRSSLSDMATTLTSATKALNDVTGYTSIERLKLAVESLEAELKQTKSELKQAKQNYTDAIQRRSDLQKEINDLLTRKHNWTPEDLERFTELYRNDHQNQQEETNAELKLEDAELAVDAVQVKLTQLILTRYHEEQIWSDKIRQALTWGTWMLMGVNVLVFTVATIFVEPWKRRRLVDAFHEEVQQKLDKFTLEIQQISEKLDGKPSGEPLKNAYFSQSNLKENGLPQTYPLTFASVRSWSTFQEWVKSTFWAIRDPNTQIYNMEKIDFGIFSAILLTLGTSLGAALTYLVVGYK